jgi:oxysterol-binding protein-related protein 9/10/11
VKQLGHAYLSLTPPGKDKSNPADQEYYLITLPSIHIESLIYGTPYVELEKSTKIASSSGYVSKIDFSGKGWLSGKKNTFSAVLYKESDGEKHPLYTADGQWSSSFTLRDARSKKDVETFTVSSMKTTSLTIAPLEEQDAYESRRAWRDVAQGIERGDMDATSVAKSKIEVAQRELRKKEKDQGTEWERRFFKRVNEKEDHTFMRLATMLDLTHGNGAGIDSDRTGGVWRFDEARAVDATPPYHKVGSEGLGL